jgi:hypothetical protein
MAMAVSLLVLFGAAAGPRIGFGHLVRLGVVGLNLVADEISGGTIDAA